MRFFATGNEHPLFMPVQRAHDADPRKHRRSVLLSHQEQSPHCGMPFFGLVFCPWQLSNVVRGVAERRACRSAAGLVLRIFGTSLTLGILRNSKSEIGLCRL
jgi:hypothetical protein